MIDLRQYLKLPVQYNREDIHFGNDIVVEHIEERTLDQMNDVLLNDNLTCPHVFYKVYTAVSRRKDTEAWRKLNMAYNITVMLPNIVGIEYIKTFGHYNHFMTSRFYMSPEIIEVIYGSGLVILQKPKIQRKDGSEIFDTYNFSEIEESYLVRVSKGDKLVIPPGCAHVIVNNKNQPLILGNVQSLDTKHISNIIRDLHGASYYVIHKNARMEVVQNPRYKVIKPIKKVKVGDLRFLPKLSKVKSIYAQVLENPKKFDWISNPDSFSWE